MSTSSLFQTLFLERYDQKPYILTLRPRSTLMVAFKRNSINMKVGDSAILNPSIIVVKIRMQQVASSPM